jgi:4-amino-4-deoxy-L-arabinose transferase-like glycosyltransferase
VAALLHRLEPRARAYWLIALACALPRLAVLVHERVTVLYAFVEKSDRFAATFVDSGTFGLIPGEPSAYTQPIYGFFLVPVYWIFGRHWWAMGGAQILLAIATAWIVYELGRRVASPRVGLLAALAATLHPYLIWHDVHVNREIVDHFLGALLVLLTLVAVDRRSWRWAGLLGVVLGLAILANSRLALLPVAVAAYVAWRLRDRRLAVLAVAAIIVGAGVAMAPWVVRNKIELGCFTVTTDARALWKANNTRTYDLVSRGKWIDDVPDLPDSPTSPADAFGKWDYGAGPVEHVDECAFQRYYQHRVVEFWKEHPGEKAKLAGQATAVLWDPRVNDFEGSNGDTSGLAQLRMYVEGPYMAIVFLLAAIGIFRVPRWFAALALLFLAYETLAAAVFAGQTRYRVPWDFVLVLLAAYAAVSFRRPSSQER